MTKRAYLLLSALLLITFHTFSQKKLPEKEIKFLQQDARAALELEEYKEALEEFKKLYTVFPEDPEIEYLLGTCYMFSNHDEKAYDHLIKAKNAGFRPDEEKPIYFQKSELFNEWYSHDFDFMMARAYHLKHEWDLAEEHYRLFRERYDAHLVKHPDPIGDQVIDHFVEMCENGKKYEANKIENVTITNIGQKINTEYEEIVPLISADEKMMVFTSRRPGSTGKKIAADGKYYEDIYMSLKNQDGEWRKPWKVKINTDEHDACVSLSPDGHHIIIYKNNSHHTGDLYESTFKGNKWQEPIKFPKEINSKYVENSATISADMRTLIFTSNRPGGFGGEDLYISHRNDDGSWTMAENMGPTINTMYDEDAPYLHPDGKTLYFSSRGHSTMGGYDIFRSQVNLKSNSFSKPENMGYPINDADDDIFFVWSADGLRGYYSSHHEDSFGDQDLYMMTVPPPPHPIILLRGIISDVTNGTPIYSEIDIFDNETGEEISTITSNSINGRYTIVLPPGKDYGIHVTSEGYMMHSENFSIVDTNVYFEQELNIALEPVQNESLIELKNVFFDNNKSDLKESAFAELNKIVTFLNEHPELDIEIAGHTELGGYHDNNIKLSQARAESVMAYLEEKGVKKSRIRSIGYGERFPKNNGGTAEERKLNRRTEIILHNPVEEGKRWDPYYEAILEKYKGDKIYKGKKKEIYITR